ncbi:hypothetical protein ON010_g18373 [Phytophthora cinnamomi]|nr:hypothetical protein ON010_g18373 [Phytophthora cinnamomi]
MNAPRRLAETLPAVLEVGPAACLGAARPAGSFQGLGGVGQAKPPKPSLRSHGQVRRVQLPDRVLAAGPAGGQDHRGDGAPELGAPLRGEGGHRQGRGARDGHGAPAVLRRGGAAGPQGRGALQPQDGQGGAHALHGRHPAGGQRQGQGGAAGPEPGGRGGRARVRERRGGAGARDPHPDEEEQGMGDALQGHQDQQQVRGRVPGAVPGALTGGPRARRVAQEGARNQVSARVLIGLYMCVEGWRSTASE